MESNLLLAIFVLLAASVVLVPVAKIAGLGPVLGYLSAGILIGPYGLALVSDTETIMHVSEFGVVMMLFLIGLELQPRELWHMRHQVLGLGLAQLAGTAAALMGIFVLIGLAWPTALIVGLALAMSSTAIAMQAVGQREITKTNTGRATLSVLLLQDISVIPILAAIPILATMTVASTGLRAELAEVVHAVEASPTGWMDALVVIGAFTVTLIASRFLVRPFMSFVASSGVREVFTALGLALVIGAALLTQLVGLSPALGAFLGGMLLADSEYRHELQSNLEPFKGLLLGLFFVSVGMSIAFSVVVAEPLTVLALLALLIGIKIAVLFGLTSLWRMEMGERLLVSVLLSQAGEFAFVLLQFASTAGAMSVHDYELLTVVVALSMATTPLLLLVFDRFVAPRLYRHPKARASDAISHPQSIIVLGYGRFGQIVTRMLRGQGFAMTLIDDDPAQIETVRRFGVKVFYGDGGRLDLLDAAGAREAKLIVVAVGGRERITEIARQVRRHFPHVMIAARAIDRSHVHELMDLGVHAFERETFRAALKLGARALMLMGYSEPEARRLAEAFEEHDNKLLFDSYGLRNDEEAYIGFVRQSVETLNELLKADSAAPDPSRNTPSPERSE